jgi:hypothetical protein
MIVAALAVGSASMGVMQKYAAKVSRGGQSSVTASSTSSSTTAGTGKPSLPALGGRGLHSFIFQINLSRRISHTKTPYTP